MKFASFLAIFVACAALSGCAGSQQRSSEAKPLLAVSIEPQRKMLEELSGGRFEVFSVMPSGANPETYDPPMSARARLSDSKAYFTIGYLPFEEAIGAGLPVVETSAGIVPVTGTHSHGPEGHDHEHGHGDADPHVWTSLRNAKAMAYTMMAYLVKADPDNADTYRANFSKMASRLDSLDRLVSDRLMAADAHAFAVWHPSLSYFARDYGLHQIAIGQESKEMPISALKKAIDEARSDSVKVFFFQKEYDSRQAENVNREIGSRIVNINPLAYDWEEQILLVADELTK